MVPSNRPNGQVEDRIARLRGIHQEEGRIAPVKRVRSGGGRDCAQKKGGTVGRRIGSNRTPKEGDPSGGGGLDSARKKGRVRLDGIEFRKSRGDQFDGIENKTFRGVKGGQIQRDELQKKYDSWEMMIKKVGETGDPFGGNEDKKGGIDLGGTRINKADQFGGFFCKSRGRFGWNEGRGRLAKRKRE